MLLHLKTYQHSDVSRDFPKRFCPSNSEFIDYVLVFYDITTQKVAALFFRGVQNNRGVFFMYVVSDSYFSQSCLHFFKMSVMWRETDPNKRFLLGDVHSAKHDSLDE